MDPSSKVRVSGSENPNTDGQDVDMSGTQGETNDRNEANTSNEASGRNEGEGEQQSQQDAALPDAPAESAPAEQADPTPAKPPTPAKKPQGVRFLDYLTSPIVELVVGNGDNETVLMAHQNLLLESSFLAESIANFNESGPRRIYLHDENVEAFSCFLQYQYTHDYSTLQPEAPEQGAIEIDNTGEQLLKHARVYTLAEKLGIRALKTNAHSKIHRINSAPQGEIVYARYVYTHTPVDDVTIRKPVAAFWATRSHVLRHEAEEGFKKLCIEVPEFCFDVLTLVLDQKEKRSQDKAEESGARASGRKRLRAGL